MWKPTPVASPAWRASAMNPLTRACATTRCRRWTYQGSRLRCPCRRQHGRRRRTFVRGRLGVVADGTTASLDVAARRTEPWLQLQGSGCPATPPRHLRWPSGQQRHAAAVSGASGSGLSPEFEGSPKRVGRGVLHWSKQRITAVAVRDRMGERVDTGTVTAVDAGITVLATGGHDDLRCSREGHVRLHREGHVRFKSPTILFWISVTKQA